MQIKCDTAVLRTRGCSNDIRALEQQQNKSHHRITPIKFNLHNYEEEDEEFLTVIQLQNILSSPFKRWPFWVASKDVC